LRIELGALIIQEMMNYTDREVIAQIQENPYLQYFLGYQEYGYRRVFDPSLLVTIRKRLDREAIAELTRVIAECQQSLEPATSIKLAESDDSGAEGGDEATGAGVRSQSAELAADEESPDESSSAETTSVAAHRGELILDATAAELEIPYPTDLGLLNEARLQSERLIDLLWSVSLRKGRKPRTYRKKAKAAYLSVAKKRRKSKKVIGDSFFRQVVRASGSNQGEKSKGVSGSEKASAGRGAPA